MSSTSELEQALAPFLSAGNILTAPISTLSVLFFIYGIYFWQYYLNNMLISTSTLGIYCFIFGLSIYVLFYQNTVHRLYKGGNIALFLLATIYTSVLTWGLSRQALIDLHAVTTKEYNPLILYLYGDDGETAWYGTASTIPTLMNSIADAMLIHRCYLIFNSSKLVLFPLVIAACILNGTGFASDVISTIGFGTSSKPDNPNLILKGDTIDYGVAIAIAIFQLILTLLTGGRIWWITRQARQFMGGSTRTRYNDIVAIIIESGLLYAGCMLTGTIFNMVLDHQSTGTVPFDLSVVTILMSGLAPTMVFARVAYGKSVNSIQQTISTFQVASAQASQQTGIGQATIDF
ncbi:hypothetical protein E1B28_002863 [Marasmius oreades]|uniref:Uncharacterized protein n=1 Tax=Marasmius oreades TaxID=181124 RepID=A0A9P7RPM7_9AGAR|nr:uncharacterized protein E1B28_002863 [Marasmius oreades]KAG7086946.1 hypothetical protein E1B28_002863 [Marasmius oreades]